MVKKEYYVVTEEWFNEDENPSTQSQVADVCDTLEDAQEQMESLITDFEEDNVGITDKERKQWTFNNEDWKCGCYKNDDTLWYEVKITYVGKTFDKEGMLDNTEIKRV